MSVQVTNNGNLILNEKDDCETYKGFEITKEDSGYADRAHRFLAHQNDGEFVRHWGATIEEVKESIDKEILETHDYGSEG